MSDTEKKTFTLELTEDELMILRYVTPRDSWGDPLKDLYEMYQGSDREQPDNAYEILESLAAKVYALRWKP